MAVDERAVGILEVFGLTTAFLAADAGCKAADVTLETFEEQTCKCRCASSTSFGNHQV